MLGQDGGSLDEEVTRSGWTETDESRTPSYQTEVLFCIVDRR